VTAPTPYYAACSSNNIRNLEFDVADVGGSGSFDLVADGSSYDCCVQCQLRAGCAGSLHTPDGGCFLADFSAARCDGTSQRETIHQLQPTGGVAISNSGCGQWTVTT